MYILPPFFAQWSLKATTYNEDTSRQSGLT